MKKKQAGIERPYTLDEFAMKVKELAKDAGIEYLGRLDYFSPDSLNRETELTTESVDVISITYFGGSEGIYSGFYLRGGYFNGDVCFAVAKTLGESDDDYIRMSVLAAKICLLARDYLRNHREEFNWSGFDMCQDDITNAENWFSWSRLKERAIMHLAEYAERYPGHKWFYRDNATREMFEYKAK